MSKLENETELKSVDVKTSCGFESHSRHYSTERSDVSGHKWLEKATATYNFHRSKLILDNEWNITKTARALRRSIGSIGEDLMIARWYKTHRKQLERIDNAYEVLEFIRKRKKEMELE